MGKGPKGFTAVEENRTGTPRSALREGDLFLREMNGKLYHAGIYCGNNEVIDFTGSIAAVMEVIRVHISHVRERRSLSIISVELVLVLYKWGTGMQTRFAGVTGEKVSGEPCFRK